MKEFEVSIRLRNNLLKQRRLELGFGTARAAAAAIGVSYNVYSAFETMRFSPLGKDGDWRPLALKIAAYHGVPPEELWPSAILGVEKNLVERQIGADEIGQLLSGEAPLLPDEALEQAENEREVRRLVGNLPEREQKLIERFYADDAGSEELADELGVSRGRVYDVLRNAQDRIRKQMGSRVPDDADAVETDRQCPVWKRIPNGRMQCQRMLTSIRSSLWCPEHGDVGTLASGG